MEEDEETPKAIPPWVELEYAVRRTHISSTPWWGGRKKKIPSRSPT